MYLTEDRAIAMFKEKCLYALENQVEYYRGLFYDEYPFVFHSVRASRVLNKLMDAEIENLKTFYNLNALRILDITKECAKTFIDKYGVDLINNDTFTFFETLKAMIRQGTKFTENARRLIIFHGDKESETIYAELIPKNIREILGVEDYKLFQISEARFAFSTDKGLPSVICQDKVIKGKTILCKSKTSPYWSIDGYKQKMAIFDNIDTEPTSREVYVTHEIKLLEQKEGETI